MVQFRPLPTSLVTPEWAERVVAPAHDSMTDAQRAKFVEDNPNSYLTVTRSPQPGSDETVEEMVLQGKAALDQLIADGAFGPVIEQFYVYELQNDALTQRAIVGGADVQGYLTKQIKTHEEVHQDRLELLTRHFEVVGAQSSPIALAHRHNDAVAEAISRTCESADPLLDVETFGLRQRVWPIEASDSEAITSALADEPFYVIDGHHRVGTAARYLERNENPAGRWTHTALFAADELNNLAYHRVLNNMSPATFLEAVEDLVVRRSVDLPRDQSEQELLFHTGEEWVLVGIPIERSETDPLAHLDPVALHRQILAPIFGFAESDVRVSYRPGEDPLGHVALLAAGDGILCAMRPISIPDLLAVADAGINMPPKSTYFSPKVRSGMFLRPLTPEVFGA